MKILQKCKQPSQKYIANSSFPEF